MYELEAPRDIERRLRRRRRLAAAVALALVAMLVAPARPAGAADKDDCESGDPARTIRGCTRIILGVRGSPAQRQHALYMRGLAYMAGGSHARAIADFTAAIKLRPTDALAFNERGLAFTAAGDLERAVADFTEAIRLDPDDADIFYNRGNARAARDDFAGAIADYDQAIRLGPGPMVATAENGAITKLTTDQIRSDYFANRALANFLAGRFQAAASDFAEAAQLHALNDHQLLWRHLATARAGGQPGAAALESARAALKPANWPVPAIELLLGSRTPEATLAAATNPDDRCEAQFYIGEWHLIRGDRPAAITALRAAADACPTDLAERQAARVELRRLAP